MQLCLNWSEKEPGCLPLTVQDDASQREEPESSSPALCDITPEEQWPEACQRATSARLYLVTLHILYSRTQREMIATRLLSIIESSLLYNRHDPFEKFPALSAATAIIGFLTIVAPQES